MSDYVKTINFTAKDALASGESAKLIKGADFDAELSAVAAASTTKYDSDDIASVVEAKAASTNLKLMTPDRVDEWAGNEAAILQDLQLLTVAGFSAADHIFGWDTSGGAAIGFTIGTGLVSDDTAINVIGGDGITANADDIALTDQAATTDEPFDLSSGVFSLDFTALTNIDGNALAAADEFIVDVGGVKRTIAYADMGLNVQLAQTTQTLAAADSNTIMEFDGTATVTIPANAAVAFPPGCAIILVVDHATQEVTVTADTGVTLNSVNHPGGGSAESDTITAGGTAVLIKTDTNDWYLSGDTSD